MNKFGFHPAPAIALLLFLLTGCGGMSRQTYYYSLYAPGQHTAAPAPTGSAVAVSVGPVTVPDILKQAFAENPKFWIDNGDKLAERWTKWAGTK